MPCTLLAVVLGCADPEPAPPVGECLAVPADPPAEPTWSRKPRVALRVVDVARLDGSPALLERDLRVRIGALRYCYEDLLKRDANRAGRMLLVFSSDEAADQTIPPHATVLLDELGDAGMAACVRTKIGRWELLDLRGDVLVELAFDQWRRAVPDEPGAIGCGSPDDPAGPR